MFVQATGSPDDESQYSASQEESTDDDDSEGDVEEEEEDSEVSDEAGPDNDAPVGRARNGTAQ